MHGIDVTTLRSSWTLLRERPGGGYLVRDDCPGGAGLEQRFPTPREHNTRRWLSISSVLQCPLAHAFLVVGRRDDSARTRREIFDFHTGRRERVLVGDVLPAGVLLYNVPSARRDDRSRRRTRPALRFIRDCFVVWLAYAALGIVAWAGSAFCYLGIAQSTATRPPAVGLLVLGLPCLVLCPLRVELPRSSRRKRTAGAARPGGPCPKSGRRARSRCAAAGPTDDEPAPR